MNIKHKVSKLVTGLLTFSLTTMTVTSQLATLHASSFVETNISDKHVTIENGNIKKEYTIENGHILTSRLENKRANTALVPQKGSEDFVINLLSKQENPNIPPEITNKPQYVIEGVESAIDRSAWKASLKNKDGNTFADSEVAKLFDNDKNTYVDKYSISGNPFTLEIDMGSKQSITSMSVMKRPGYNDEAYGINGTMGGYTISVKERKNDEWKEIKTGAFTDKDYNLHKEGDLYNVGDMVFVNFDATDAQFVKVEQTSAALGQAEEFTSAEINFYSKALKKTQKEVKPVNVLNRKDWNVTIKNKDGQAFSKAQIDTLIDGSTATNPDEYSKSGNPFFVDIDLGSKQKVSSLSIDKRPGYSDAAYGINGTMGEFEVYVSEDGQDWEIAGAGNFTKDAYGLHEDGGLHNVGNRVYANFLKTYETRYVRLVQKSCSMGSSEEFTSSELNLYEDQYIGLNWNTEVSGQSIPSAIQSSKLTYKETKVTNTNEGKKITISYEPYVKDGVTYTINQVLVAEGNDHYLRSFIEIQVDNKDKAQIDYIDQDRYVLANDVNGVWSHPDDSKISSQWIGKHELMLGQPIYVNGFFMGSEFPATDTIIKNNETQIRYYSGKTFAKLEEDGQLTKDGKFVSWQNVIGAARGVDTSVVQTDFYEYIEKIATPTEFRKQYNSWYDNMMNITDESIAKSFLGAEKGLTMNGVEPLDSYVVDDGWNNYYDGTFTSTPGSSQGTTENQTGFWEFNAKFPNELYTSSSLSSKLLSSFGVWVGPQGGYNYFGSFSKYLQSVGTGYVQSNSALGDVVCTGSKKYLRNFKNRFVDYQQRFDIDYWKWDGFASRPCNNPEHDHMVGGDNNMYFTTDMWEGWIDVFNAVRADRAKQGKGLFINATCYINLSPWLLQWVNTIWVQDSGDTGQLGTGDRHQQKITYRDEVYYKLYKQNQIQFPLKNIYNHDPIYGVSDGSEATTDVFREYLMANAVRGTAFWELYYSPSIFDDAKWKVNADVLDFAEQNHEILKNAKLFGNEPSKGVYGYSSWKGTEGIVSFTNPLDSEQTYALTIDETIGAVQALNNAQGIQVEPYKVGLLNQRLSYGDTIRVTLAPHETRILQYGHTDTQKPTLLSCKVTGKDEVTLKFSERVANHDVYKVNGKSVESTLKEDYRSVVLKTDKEFKKDEDVAVTISSITDVYGNSADIKTTVKAYEDATIAEVTSKKDVSNGDDISETLQQSTNQNFMKIKNEKVVDTKQAFTGTGDFSISFAVKTNAKNTTLFKQGDDIEIALDSNGFVTFKAKGTSVTSKEKVTSVIEKAHGLFGTDAYVPTSTQDELKGNVSDNKTHTINAVREPNGMLKLYIDGNLSASAYDKKALHENIAKGVLTIGGNTFTGYLSNIVLKNNSISYEDAAAFAKTYNIDVKATILDRSAWKASACSQMEGTIGDSTAMAAIDGKDSTWWHTNYLGGDTDAVHEHWIEIDFGKDTSFDNFIYTGRGGSNGDIKDFILEGNVNGKWVTLKEGTFKNEITNTIPMGKTITASAIRLKPVTTQNGQNYAAAVEINISRDLENEADAKAIQDLKEKAVLLQEDDYTKSSAKAYMDVYTSIHQLDEFNAGETLVQDLTKQLERVTNELVSIKSLKEEVKKAKTLINEQGDLLTSTYLASLQMKLDAATSILNKDTASKEEIAKMEQELIAIVNAPQYKPVDKKALHEIIQKAEALIKDEDIYTRDSIAKLKEVLKNAKEVEANQNATQADIEKTIAALQTAILELKKLPQIPDQPSDVIKTTLKSSDGTVHVDGTFIRGTILDANKLSVKDVMSVIKDKEYLSKITLEKGYDISLRYQNEVVQPIGAVKVTFNLDGALAKKKLGVMFIDANGKIQILNSKQENHKLVFETTHFSKYAIISYEDKLPVPSDQNDGVIHQVSTGDKTSTRFIISIMIMSFAAGISLLLYRKRMNKSQN